MKPPMTPETRIYVEFAVQNVRRSLEDLLKADRNPRHEIAFTPKDREAIDKAYRALGCFRP